MKCLCLTSRADLQSGMRGTTNSWWSFVLENMGTSKAAWTKSRSSPPTAKSSPGKKQKVNECYYHYFQHYSFWYFEAEVVSAKWHARIPMGFDTQFSRKGMCKLRCATLYARDSHLLLIFEDDDCNITWAMLGKYCLHPQSMFVLQVTVMHFTYFKKELWTHKYFPCWGQLSSRTAAFSVGGNIYLPAFWSVKGELIKLPF